jgi:ketosteroid isomerase-like protein
VIQEDKLIEPSRKEIVMKLFCLIILLALANSSASSGYAQDDPIKVKTKGGVTIIKDKTKPTRRELEAVFEQRMKAAKDLNFDAQMALISPDYTATLANGTIWKYEQIRDHIRRLYEQTVRTENYTCEIKIEELTVRGNEAIIEARQYCPRKQRLRDGKIHDVYTSVLQTETWVKTAGGWKLKRVENERDQVIEVDGKPANPDGTPKNPN